MYITLEPKISGGFNNGVKNQYLIDLLETVKKRNAGEPEFIQAVTEVFESLQPVVEKDRISLTQAYLRESLSLKDRSCSVYPG